MGYPMTWRRVINRNGLQDGDYTVAPERHQAQVNTSFEGWNGDEDSVKIALAPHLASRVKLYEQAFKSLSGDIRRLEKDVVDENNICKNVARLSGVDEDTVAVVLKAFMEW